MALRFPDPFPTPRRQAAGLLQKVKAFRRDEDGSFAILGGIVIVALVMFVFVAVEYSKLLGYDTEYQNAADNGALHLAKLTEADFKAGRVPAPSSYQAEVEKIVWANITMKPRPTLTRAWSPAAVPSARAAKPP
jgi:Flp pilus assembly protein TadG